MTDEQQLRNALVRPEHHRAYNTSPSFRRAVDTLVSMLPAWVDGLAEQAKVADDRSAQMLRQLHDHPIGPAEAARLRQQLIEYDGKRAK